MLSRSLVFLQFFIIAMMLWFGKGILTSIPGMIVFMVGLAIGLWALVHNRLGNFNIRPDIKHGCEMVNSGPYRFVRHPMYTSVLFMMFGVFIAAPTLLEFGFLAGLFVVLSAKALREERLWCDHHQGYSAYKSETRMFIPILW